LRELGSCPTGRSGRQRRRARRKRRRRDLGLHHRERSDDLGSERDRDYRRDDHDGEHERRCDIELDHDGERRCDIELEHNIELEHDFELEHDIELGQDIERDELGWGRAVRRMPRRGPLLPDDQSAALLCAGLQDVLPVASRRALRRPAGPRAIAQSRPGIGERRLGALSRLLR
jgi:hypothetical protein